MSETYPGQMLPELQEKTTVDSNDLFYMVSSNASKKIKGSNLKAQMKPSDYTGATSSTNGANGLVPQPTTSDVDRFLKGDGTWGDISYAVGEVSGSIASFSDGSELPMRSLKAYIEPVQSGSGEPSPSNIRPISGWTSANVNRAKVYQICEPSDSTEITANGVTMTYLGKGKYRVKGTPTANEYTALNIPIVPFTIYGGDDAYIKINNSVGLSNATLIFKNGTSQMDSWGLYPSNRSGTYVGMRNKYTNNITIAISSSGYGTNFDFTFKVEILSNSTANLSTYNISFGSAGTVYGGTLDVVSGVLTVDKKFIDVSSMVSSVGYNSSIGAGTLASTGLKPNITSETINEYISNCLKAHINSGVASMNYEFTVDSNSRILFKAPNCSSASDYQTWVTNNTLQIVGTLATPQTYQLTPTQVNSLLGENRVWADTGDVDVHYVRDLTITIDDILSRLEALEG